MNYTPRKIEFNPPRPGIDLHIKKTDARKELDAKKLDAKKQEHAREMWHKLIEKRNAEEKRLQEVRA